MKKLQMKWGQFLHYLNFTWPFGLYEKYESPKRFKQDTHVASQIIAHEATAEM